MKKTSGNMTYTEQEFFPNSQENLGMTNAVPRSTEFDLETIPHEEQNFKVTKRGNKVTRGKNY
jgi:hypothetical protein